MSIGYTGHCKLAVPDTQKRLVFIRKTHPEWFDAVLNLSDARAPRKPFDKELSREFGIDAHSYFNLDVYDKERFSECLQDALDFTYRVFGTEALLLTWAWDTIHPPLQPYPPMAID